MQHSKVALVTGGARRIGAHLCQILHQQGYSICIHYHQSQSAALALQQQLQQRRAASVMVYQADLNNTDHYASLIAAVVAHFGRLDVLINNASRYYPTPLATATHDQWYDLTASNLQAPFFLAQQAQPHLAKQQGNIINIVDINAQRPKPNYAVYCIAKAGLVMLTKALAQELAPSIRVNAIAPGTILWPEGKNSVSATQQQQHQARLPLQHIGTPDDISNAVLFILQARFMTGSMITLDGGQLLAG